MVDTVTFFCQSKVGQNAWHKRRTINSYKRFIKETKTGSKEVFILIHVQYK